MTTEGKTSTIYAVQAFNLYDTISIKAIRPLYADKVIDSSIADLQVRCGDDRYMHVYRFGCLVFFNMSEEDIAVEIARVKAFLGPEIEKPTTESFRVDCGAEHDRITFDHADLKDLAPKKVALVAQTLAQSAALEYFEVDADKMLQETSSFMRGLARTGSVPLRSKVLLRFIGSAAEKRQHITSNVRKEFDAHS